jgi:hypothetical protein
MIGLAADPHPRPDRCGFHEITTSTYYQWTPLR